ncbi:MAG: class I SAM-dependent methyltransferase, partial [Clostridiales bacterium]|nr:class I SAM-dependent methyltransferase [Clostridiales bacterium]
MIVELIDQFCRHQCDGEMPRLLAREEGPMSDYNIPHADSTAQTYAAERSACWQAAAKHRERGQKRLHVHYQSYLGRLYRFLVPEGLRILELGCAEGNLLAALKPACGVGVDFTPAMLEIAQNRHPELHYIACDALH